ncbi:MAG: methylated-DNA--[protein]-cysteine S-methyltransferase [Candidatus Aureabacteria bacterium]|nr:methylated-DNA--[protein]-cysteine S-methyltransferase [Candidatus Auribacterota bacterium]
MKNSRVKGAGVYRIRSTYGIWKFAISGRGVQWLILPPSPPAARTVLRWALAPGRGHLKSWEKAGTISLVLTRLMGQLALYFSGKIKTPRVPLDPRGEAVFARRVWGALRHIPYGETRSYGEIAKAVGSGKACRAVGNACAANPFPILVPCHRVVAKSGIGGFSAGLRWKKFLLAREERQQGSS